MKKKFMITVCASGGGGNFQAIIDERNNLDIDIIKLIVNKECGAINRALANNIPCEQISSTGDKVEFQCALDKAIPPETDLIILAGFMPIIPRLVCEKWHKKIINTHPSLLPKYGGKGMYGLKVHEEVMNNKEVISGCTIHYVDSGIDTGEIILQKVVHVDYKETPWQLGARVFKEENKLLVDVIRLLKSRASSSF